MKICPKCQHKFNDEYSFCKKCGVSLVLENKKEILKNNAKSKSNGFLGKEMIVFTVAIIIIIGSVLYNLYGNSDSFRYKLYDIGIMNPSTIEEQFYYACRLIEKKDYKNAFKWFECSANAGDADAQYNLGILYENGEGVEKNEKEAFKLYLKAAEQNDRDAQYAVGRCYKDGIGTIKNRKFAKGWFKKAAEAGHIKAQADYAFYLHLDRDYKQAFEYYNKSANAGNSYAQLRVGEYYIWGYRVVDKDYKKAIEWFEKSAEGGNTTALLNIGRCFQDGGYGVVKDLNKAAYYYNASAEKGNAIAMRKIAYCYYFAEGVDWDEKKAMEWLKKAIETEKTGRYNLSRPWSDEEEIKRTIDSWKTQRRVFYEAK